MRRSIALGTVVFLLGGGWSGKAATQEEASPKDPEAEFDRGMLLLHQARYDEACDRFERSLRLAYVGGSVLALARCRQLQGRHASAWQAFLAARDIAVRDGREDRIREADERIAEIAPHLSRLAVIPPPEPPVGLTLLRNDATIDPNAWGIAVPVDGGTYQIEARAPGMLPWTSNVAVAVVDDRVTLRVPKMRPAPRVRIAPPPGPPPAVSIPALERAGVDTERAPLPSVAYLAGALGIAGLGAGTWFGIDAVRKRNDVETMCPDLSRCAKGQDLNDRAGRAADIATVGFAVGLAGAGVAAYLLVSRPSAGQPAQDPSIAVVPVVGARSAGLWVTSAGF